MVSDEQRIGRLGFKEMGGEARMLWELFITFFKIGCVSFGGGYAMVPVIEHEVIAHGWMNTQTFSEAIAIAGTAPGPLATNAAIFVGYETDGVIGAMVSLIGVVLPSLLCVLLVVALLYRLHHHPLYQSAFYGLRPIVTGLILYAGLRFAAANIFEGALNLHALSLFVIFIFSLFALVRLKWHPALVIFLSGVIGMLFYQ
jgi:chromate transporter